MNYEMTIKKACESGFWSCLEPTDWIQLVAIILSFISILIAMYAGVASWKAAKASEKSANLAKAQLELVNQQRKDAVSPEPFIKNEWFELGYNQEMNFGRFNNEDNIVCLSMTNIGNGHAKKIKVEWDFDKLSSSINLIKTHQKEKQYLVDYKEGSYVVFSESDYTLLDIDFKSSIPMLPVGKDFKIRLPFSYTRALTIIIHFCHIKQLALDLVPNLKLSISYYDVLNNHISKEFLITPQVAPRSSSSADGEITNYKVDVLMQIDEIS